MKVTVKKYGQITIPKVFRESLDIRPGTALDFEVKNGALIIKRSDSRDFIDQVYGCLSHLKLKTNEIVATLRGR